MLAAGLEDGSIAVLSFPDGRVLRTVRGGGRRLASLEFSADDRLLLGADSRGVALYNVGGKWKRAAEIDGVAPAAFSPDGRQVAAAYAEGGIGIWNAADGSFVRLLPDSVAPVRMAFSPDGRWLATAYSVGGLRRARLWDMSPNPETAQLPLAAEKTIQALAFSPDSRLLATAGPAVPIQLWDCLTGHLVTEITPGAWVTCLVFSPDGRLLVSGDNARSVCAWGIPAAALGTGTEAGAIPGRSVQPAGTATPGLAGPARN